MKLTLALAGAACLLASTAIAKPPEFLNSGKVYPANVPLGRIGAQVEVECIAYRDK